MKKTFTINLGGIVFHIDEDAYELLDKYLSNLRIHFSKEEGAEGRLIPVPGFISADCGLGWCAKLESEFALSALMERNSITPQGIHHCLI